jgi:hypothetical protein
MGRVDRCWDKGQRKTYISNKWKERHNPLEPAPYNTHIERQDRTQTMSGLLRASKCLITGTNILWAKKLCQTLSVQRQLQRRSHLLLNRERSLQQLNRSILRRYFSSEPKPDEFCELQKRNDNLREETTSIIQLFEENGDGRAKVERATIDSLMQQWIKKAGQDGDMQAAKSCHKLLKILEDNVDGDFTTALVPDAASYNFVLQAYASCQGGEVAAETASTLLTQMISRCRESNQQSYQAPAPTTTTFNVVLNAWAKSRSKNAGTRAEEVFTELEEWRSECQDLSLSDQGAPNGRTLCAVMDAWAQSHTSDAAERVMAILEVAIERQKKLYAMGDTVDTTKVAIKPDVVMFNTAIHAWVGSRKGVYGAEKAEQLLQLMETLHESGKLGPRDEEDDDDAGLAPNTRSFTLVINAWAETEKSSKSGKGAERAEQILEDMINRYIERGEDVMPNTTTFTSCIKAWSMSIRYPGHEERAQAVFEKMADLYGETKNDALKPNAWAANTLISAWAKSHTSDSVERAEAVLQRLKEFCEPDLHTYNSIIDVYAKKEYAMKAQAVFDELAESSSLQPDLISYNTLLGAWSKFNSGQAHAVLDRMISEGIVKPDRISYTCVITACAYNKNSSKNNAADVAKVLQTMLEEYRAGNKAVKPDVVTFTSALNAAANTLGDAKAKRAALKFAISTLEQMKQSNDLDDPNHRTYGAMMKVCFRLCKGTERSRLLEGVFQQSLEAGMVNRMALDMFKQGVPFKVQEKFGVHYRNPVVPEAWCANVAIRERPTVK